MSILSIQSLVAYGHAGNSAALFPLQRLGKVVWPVMTVHFSNHTGYGDWKGPLLTSSDVADVIEGVGDRGALERCEAVLSGYQGAEDVGAVILDAVRKVKTANPEAIYCCDPVMGDVGRGMFVRPGIPEFMRDQVVPAADVITPNHFELDYLAATPTTTTETLLAAADTVRATGPGTVLVTSVIVEDTPDDALDMVAVDASGAWRTRFPRLSVNPPGAGDLTTAVFLANLLDGRPLAEALARTTASVFAVVRATAEAGERELRIVQTQDELAEPTRTFEPERLR
ncbi:pyridoxal kinase PdxY [Nocardioides iriomotensis]|uniref:pyridoxal kinase n=1 Tax=Nocardioides iriomotensis TaxID=715784 RepID=A0A4Q5J4G7_9ACTN|nr:pyridoxal kinase PdxY [Nocardioides iriomotensis]RYU13414.1 pyridoxal kinase PdxY [Nocardioides iriomotensis]